MKCAYLGWTFILFLLVSGYVQTVFASEPNKQPKSLSTKSLSVAVLGSVENCAELLSSLCDGIIPLKFTYLGNGAKLWQRLMQNSSSVANEPEMRLFNLRAPKVLVQPSFKHGTNVVDIGPGDGRKAAEILKYGNLGQSSYLAIDISPSLISLAQRHLLTSNSKLKFSGKVVDVDQQIAMK